MLGVRPGPKGLGKEVDSMNWREKYRNKLVSAEEAVKAVKSGDRIIVNLGGEPSHCLHALAKRADELRGVKMACSWSYDYPWFHPGLENSFDVGTTFTARATRLALRERRISYIPWLPGLGERDRCLEQGRACVQQHADVAFVVVTPPDDQGYCSFGNQYWNAPNAVRTAKVVVAEVNEKIPFVFGENVPVSKIDYLVEAPEDSRPTTMPGTEWTTTNVEEWEKEQVIASIAADLVRDGDTLQVGIGTPS